MLNKGVSDDRIILMIAEEVSCNPRNNFCGEIFGDVQHSLNLYGSTTDSASDSSNWEKETNHGIPSVQEKNDYNYNANSLGNIEIDYQVSA